LHFGVAGQVLREIDPTVDLAAELRKIDLSGRRADELAARKRTEKRKTEGEVERDL
jgi:hypothetical protein